MGVKKNIELHRSNLKNRWKKQHIFFSLSSFSFIITVGKAKGFFPTGKTGEIFHLRWKIKGAFFHPD